MVENNTKRCSLEIVTLSNFGENVKFSLYFSDERRLIQQGRESVYFKN